MSALLEPVTLRGVTARNRVWLAPMCQYSCFARDGVPTDWHLAHLVARASGGFGLLLTEATAVVPEGRISPEDTGLWDDAQQEAWGRVVAAVHEQGVPIGVQLAHAGRKASTFAPFADPRAAATGEGSVPVEDGGWETVAPSAVAFPGYATPRALSLEEVRELPARFADAARRADAAGFDAVEVHAAHGYLLHQFLSPLSNERDDEYGGSFENRTRLVVEVVDAVRAAIRPGETRLVWVETPTNPLLGIGDIEALAAVAHDAGALLVVDNTFASPYLQQPLALGADVVVHSTTKYVGGHSDVVGGALVVRDDALADRIRFHQNAMGAVAGPFDAWLTLRGLKTLAVRMDRHCDNAERIVAHLLEHPAVEQVIYPGLTDHPGHEVAARQMKRFGGMVSFRVKGGEAAALAVCERTHVFTLGESLGGVESLIEHPGRMTHASVAGTDLEVPADLVRLSVGIESVDDLVADLDQALSSALSH